MMTHFTYAYIHRICIYVSALVNGMDCICLTTTHVLQDILAVLTWWYDNEDIQGQWVNTLRPRQNGRHFADDIFKCFILNENVWIPIKISLKVVPKGPINNIPALVQIMAWRRPGDKPLSGPMMVRLPMHICVTPPQWVNPISSEMLWKPFWQHDFQTHFLQWQSQFHLQITHECRIDVLLKSQYWIIKKKIGKVWVHARHCGYWCPDTKAPGHHYPQCWWAIMLGQFHTNILLHL